MRMEGRHGLIDSGRGSAVFGNSAQMVFPRFGLVLLSSDNIIC